MFHFGGIRIIMMAAMGLGALYMMHLLAQDYNKIRQPIMRIRSFLRLKRDLYSDESLNNVPQPVDFDIKWERILKYDSTNCLQSLACQLFAGAEPDNEDGQNIKTLLQFSLTKSPPKAIVSATKRGLAFNGEPRKCFKEYYYCFYSAATMLRILRIFSDIL